LKARYEKEKYSKHLIFNYDETNLLVKHFTPQTAILPHDSFLLPQEEQKQVIVKCTACLTICADGSHLSPSLILPETVPSELLKSYISPNLKIFQSQKGYVNKEILQNYMLTILLKQILERKQLFSEEGLQPPSLLYLDGHSSRINKHLWKTFADNGITVCILPPHTSHFLQPLDLGVNAALNRLLQHAHPMPKARRLGGEIEDWLEDVEDCVIDCMERKTVRNCFAVTGLCPLLPQMVLRKLPEKRPPLTGYKVPKLELGGNFITDESFLSTWPDTGRVGEDEEREQGIMEAGEIVQEENSIETEAQKKKGRITQRHSERPSTKQVEITAEEEEGEVYSGEESGEEGDDWEADPAEKDVEKQYRKKRNSPETELVIVPKESATDDSHTIEGLKKKLQRYEDARKEEQTLLEKVKASQQEERQKTSQLLRKAAKRITKTLRKEREKHNVQEEPFVRKKRKMCSSFERELTEEESCVSLIHGRSRYQRSRGRRCEESALEEDSDVVLVKCMKRGEEMHDAGSVDSAREDRADPVG
jgi:hypothetical protein